MLRRQRQPVRLPSVPLLDGRFPLWRVWLLLPQPRLQLPVGSLVVASGVLLRLLHISCVACSLPLLLLLPRVQDFGGLWLYRGRLLGRVGPGELVLAVKMGLQRRQFFLCGLGPPGYAVSPYIGRCACPYIGSSAASQWV